jgi:polygalacturonase
MGLPGTNAGIAEADHSLVPKPILPRLLHSACARGGEATSALSQKRKTSENKKHRWSNRSPGDEFMRLLRQPKFLPGFLAVLAVTFPALAGNKIDIREHGAKGDGQVLDSAAIQKVLDDCAEAGGGEVVFPPGRYLSGTIHLRSGVTLHLQGGARLIGTTNLAHYAQPRPPDLMPEAKWGKWHRGLIIGENIEDVAITGPGVIDGNKVFDPTGEERMRGPHTIVLVNCRRFTLREVTIVDAANYAVFFQVSDDVEVRNVTCVGGWDGVHWRGSPERWCQNVQIMGCQFYTGDDAIAGRYWNNTVIKDCLINSSCNGIRLIGPRLGLRS